jgi:hypothetical protein
MRGAAVLGCFKVEVRKHHGAVLFSQWRKLWKKRWVALHGAEVVYMDAEPTVENSATMTITKAEVQSSCVTATSFLFLNQVAVLCIVSCR